MSETALSAVWRSFIGEGVATNALRSIALVSLVLLLRALVSRLIASSSRFEGERGLALQTLSRNAFVAATGAGLLIIWAQALQDWAISLAAIAVAIALATKELSLCFLGYVLRASSTSFSVGDRIEVNGVKGDVVDIRLLSTTLLEVGAGHQRTGRAVVIPNAQFLSYPIINETFTKAYVLHLVSVRLSSRDDWRRAELLLLEAASEVCAPFIDAARRYMGQVARRHSLQTPMVGPRVMVHFDAEQITLMTRVPTPARERGRIEQQILRRFFDKLDRIPSDGDAPSER